MTNDQGRAEGALFDARMALDSAQLSEAQVATAAESRLQSIADAWQGIIEVRVELDDGVLSGPNTRLALDVIEECVANAARHSSASVVDVSLRSTAGGLEVHVRDNGTPFTTTSAPGMGSDWMRRISAGRMTRSRSTAGWNQVSLVLGDGDVSSDA
jgi:signal transduction histidine kinase